MVAGLAFGYTHTNTSFDTSALSLPGQFLHDDTFTGNVYTTVAFTDALYLNAIALVGGGNTNSQRRIVIPFTNTGAMPVDQTATGSFGTQMQGVNVSSGYTLPFGSLVVTPIVRFSYQHTRCRRVQRKCRSADQLAIQQLLDQHHSVVPRRRCAIHDEHGVWPPLSDGTGSLVAPIQPEQNFYPAGLRQRPDPDFGFELDLAGNTHLEELCQSWGRLGCSCPAADRLTSITIRFSG